jgi:hypothetical protein
MPQIRGISSIFMGSRGKYIVPRGAFDPSIRSRGEAIDFI